MVCRGDVVTNWEYFRQQWEDYEVATGLDEQTSKIRLASLRSVMGKECVQIFLNLHMTPEQREDVTACLDAVEAYFKPQKNVVYERFLFNSCMQESDESFDAFLHKLRKLAATCEFGSLTDEMIRDRIVIGVRDTGLKGRLLREHSLSLTKTIELSKASEIAKQQLHRLEQGERKINEEVNFVKRTQRPKAKDKHKPKPPSQRCKFCGNNKTHKKKEDCPAYGQECRSCHKKNHFATVCNSKKQNRVNFVEEEEEYDSHDSDLSLLTIETVAAVTGKGRQLLAKLNFCVKDCEQANLKVPVTCQLDTGASCNVISYRDLSVLMQVGEPPLDVSQVKLKMFDGSTLKPIGETLLKVEHKGKQHSLSFQVVAESRNKPLLSAESCEQLGLIKLDTVHSMQCLADPITEDYITTKYKDVFEGLGHIGDATFKTDEKVQPVQHAPRRVPVALRDEVKRKLADLEAKGIVKKVTEPTEWISSMVIVAKPGKLRICLDPRDLNRALQRPKYLMPTLEEILPCLSKAKVFTTLDAKDGFYQIGLDEESSLKTTFWTPFGRYRYLRMPFGVSVAPEEFECKLHEKLDDLPGVIVIRDDVLVTGHGETYEEAVEDHDQNLVRLLDRAKQVNLKLNKAKMKLRKAEVEFMGHVVTKDGLKPDPRKIKAVEEMPRPSCKKETLSLLGFINYLSKFLPRLSEVAQPLRELTMTDAEFLWSPQHEEALQQVKQLVINHPVLKYYDPSEEATLQCDASEYGLGATLLQKGQPVAFASRTLSRTERNYAQIEKECLAIVFGCERFTQYLAQKDKVQVESDHKPLQAIFKKPIHTAPCRLQRMLLRLLRYNLDVQYKPGKLMFIADHLSRAPTAEVPEHHDEAQVFAVELEQMDPFDTIKIAPEKLAQLQQCTGQDPVLQILKNTVLSGWPERREQVPVPVREFWTYRDEISVHNAVLFKSHRVIIPAVMRAEILRKIHSSHMGIQSSLRKAKDLVFWPCMSSQIKETVANCQVCAEFQARNPKQPMQTHEVPDRPWSRVAADLFTLHGKEYAVLVDYYSDFIEVGELPDTTSTAVVHFLKEQFSRHGIPDCLMTDNGSQLTSREFKKFISEWEVNHVTSSPHHPRSNGKAESAVKIAKGLFKKALKSGHDPWLALLDHRNTPVEGLESSPTQRLMSRRTRTQVPTATSLLYPRVISGVEEKIKRKRQTAKAYYDRTAKTLPDLQVGQEVKVAPLHKSQIWKTGTCLQQLSDRSYLVQMDKEVVRRNRAAVKPAPQRSQETDKPDAAVQRHVTSASPATAITTDAPRESMSNAQQPMKNTVSSVPPQTRRTRTRAVNPPPKFKDFVMT